MEQSRLTKYLGVSCDLVFVIWLYGRDFQTKIRFLWYWRLNEPRPQSVAVVTLQNPDLSALWRF